MKRINVELEYALGEIVYYRTDKDNTAGMVVGVLFDMSGGVCYRVSFSGEITYVYADEISTDKNYI